MRTTLAAIAAFFFLAMSATTAMAATITYGVNGTAPQDGLLQPGWATAVAEFTLPDGTSSSLTTNEHPLIPTDHQLREDNSAFFSAFVSPGEAVTWNYVSSNNFTLTYYMSYQIATYDALTPSERAAFDAVGGTFELEVFDVDPDTFQLGTSGDTTATLLFVDGVAPGTGVGTGTGGGGTSVSAVPLPAAGWMLLAGFGGLMALKRR